MKVIGVDPSLTATGIATAYGTTFTSKGGKGDARLVRLYEDVLKTAREADLAVIEDLPTNAMGAGLTGRSQGVVRMALQRSNTPLVAIPPASLKKFATNHGGCDKEAMARAFEKVVDIDAWQGGCPDDNQVDAWWLRQAGLYWLGLVEMEGDWRRPALTDIKVNKKTGKARPVIDWTGWEIAL